MKISADLALTTKLQGMIDKTFRELVHVASGFVLAGKPGSQVAKGYKPDVAFRKGNRYILMECNTGTTRKDYVGGMIKAAKFLSGINSLICVIKESRNTKVSQIQRHLIPYYRWIELQTNLECIYLIPADRYCQQDRPLKINGRLFLKHALTINRK